MRRRTTGRHLTVLRLLAPALLAVLLTGCVTLPDSSSVHAAPGSGPRQAPSLIKSSPPGPQPNATPEAIVAGYLRAMLAFPSDPALVREFMTPKAAQEWQPEAQTQIYENPEIDLVGPRAQVHVKFSPLGALDERGSWSSTPGPDLDLAMQVVKSVGGQYRIINPVSGTLINAEHFDRYFHQYSLYYYDLASRFLAPDPVYLQIGAPSATATALMHNLLLGPTASIREAVHSAAPAHTRLTPAVTVSSAGVAMVPLSADVNTLDGDQFRLLAQQVAWTLRQERVGVNHLSISVGGQVRAVSELGPVFSVTAFNSPSDGPASHTLYALGKTGRLYTVQPNGPAIPVSGPISTVDIGARSVAIDPSGESAALISGSGTRVVAGGLTPAPIATPATNWYRGGTNLLTPSWDGFGLLWLVDGNSQHAILRVATSTANKVVAAPSFTGRDIRAFAISPDGVRFAAVKGRGRNSELIVALIKRDTRSLTDVSLVGGTTIVNSAFPLSNIHGLAWVDSTHVEVLAQDQGSDSQPYLVAVDGSRVEPLGGLPLPPSPVTVAGGTGEVPTVVGDGLGNLFYQKAETQWAPLEAGLRLFAPAYPG